MAPKRGSYSEANGDTSPGVASRLRRVSCRAEGFRGSRLEHKRFARGAVMRRWLVSSFILLMVSAGMAGRVQGQLGPIAPPKPWFVVATAGPGTNRVGDHYVDNSYVVHARKDCGELAGHKTYRTKAKDRRPSDNVAYYLCKRCATTSAHVASSDLFGIQSTDTKKVQEKNAYYEKYPEVLLADLKARPLLASQLIHADESCPLALPGRIYASLKPAKYDRGQAVHGTFVPHLSATARGYSETARSHRHLR